MASCIEPHFSLKMHAKAELAKRLQASKMRHNSTSLNTCQHDVNIVIVCVARHIIVKTMETVCRAFYALVKHLTPEGHYFAHWCGKRPFSLSANGVQTRVLHACIKKNIFFF